MALRRAFSRLTVMWAAWLAGSGAASLWLLLTVVPSTYLVVKRSVTIPVMIALFLISLRYPRRVFEADPELGPLLTQGAPS